VLFALLVGPLLDFFEKTLSCVFEAGRRMLFGSGVERGFWEIAEKFGWTMASVWKG
jgi:hypothetical protein